MLVLKRPPEPPDFATKVARYKTAVQLHMDELLKEKATASPVAKPVASRSSTGTKKKKSDVFTAKWSDFKDAFSEAQHGKCAYCEVSVIGAQHGDVEHFYPKARIDGLLDDPDTWGKERPFLSNVLGRKPAVVCDTGYWWLAYEWSNYLLSCLACNEYWKGAIFPVEDDPRTIPPTSDLSEVALLLNPFEKINPAEHLAFDGFGQIHPHENSRRGFESIRTCGLDRESLRNIRGGIAREAHALSNKLIASTTSDELKDTLYSLYLKGVETNQHPGMVRIIVERRCGLTWRDVVEQLAQLLAIDLQIATGPDQIRNTLSTLYQMGDERYEFSELVRDIVLTQCGKAWKSLVEELAASLMELWAANDSNYEGFSALTFIHEMGKRGQSHSDVVRGMVQLRTGLQWADVEVRVAAGNRFH